jgi:hypothetical protein
MVTATAWAVPVLTLAIAAPAAAASIDEVLGLGISAPPIYVGDTIYFSANLYTHGGSPISGEPVTFTVVSGPASFPGGASTQAGVTLANGVATSSNLIATGPGTVTLQASVAGLPPRTVTVTVLDLIRITATNPSSTVPLGGTTALIGTVKVDGSAPATGSDYPVTYTITGGSASFPGGAHTVTVNPANGTGVVTSPTLTDSSSDMEIVTVTATVAGTGGNTVTYKVYAGYVAAAGSGTVFWGTTGGGPVGHNFIQPFLSAIDGTLVYPAGTTIDVTYTNTDPGGVYTPSPQSGWTLTQRGPAMYRWVLQADSSPVEWPGGVTPFQLDENHLTVQAYVVGLDQPVVF